MDRIILHCDLNNFFASVSLLKNQTLYNCPVAVCGDKEKRHGIVLAKNDIAKAAGVKTAEPIWQAKQKCPDLIILPPLFDDYVYYSGEVKKIYARYTDLIEPFGIDECWLDVTGSTRLFGDGETIANRIRREVKEELGLTVSVGVSFNKIFAKLGSDMKKPDATTVITKENFKQKVWLLPVEDLLFVGKRTTELLHRLGVLTIGDLTIYPEESLKKHFGKAGLELKNFAMGKDFSAVSHMDDYTPPKSIGRSITGAKDLTDYAEVWQTILVLSEEIAVHLKKDNLMASGVQLHTRTSILTVREFSKSFTRPTDIAIVIAEAAMQLFRENYHFEFPLRSVGVRAIHLKNENCAVQTNMFDSGEKDEKLRKIEESMFKIREKYGKKGVVRGSTLTFNNNN